MLSLQRRNGDHIKCHCFVCRYPFLHDPSAPAAITIFFCPCDKRIFFSVLSRLVQKLEGIYYFLLRSDFEKFILPIPINGNILNKTQYDLGFGTDGWTNELLRMQPQPLTFAVLYYSRTYSLNILCKRKTQFLSQICVDWMINSLLRKG